MAIKVNKFKLKHFTYCKSIIIKYVYHMNEANTLSDITYTKLVLLPKNTWPSTLTTHFK